jgi:superoxide reductase
MKLRRNDFMVNKKEVYKCNICGNIVEVLTVGGGELVCCKQPMQLMQEKTSDEGNEKHVPVIEGKTVKVGSVEHPMQDDHFIEWIEAKVDGKWCRKSLSPTDKPIAEFCGTISEVRAYCNVHGLWRGE